MNFLLDVNFNQSIYESGNPGEALIFGLQVFLIGIVTVFSVLCVIWACLAIFKLVLHDLPERKKNRRVDDTPVASVEEAPIVYYGSDDEIVAVIAAAIAAAESECSDVKYRVVSFRRK